jgi:tetratricopeptide (TPR) repeat protein
VGSTLNSFDQAIQLLETSRPFFEASVREHESHRRYLAQTYEVLGVTYYWQGNAFDTAQDYDSALNAYKESIDVFNQCILQDANSPDLVIQNDIVQKVCQPTLEEVQQTYNELSGGQ